MVFGKKKKEEKKEEDIKAGVIDGETVITPEVPKEQPKPTAEQLAKIEEIKKNIAYFEENYGQIDFGENFGGLKELLFGIFVELKKLNDSQNE